jgi:surface antigen
VADAGNAAQTFPQTYFNRDFHFKINYPDSWVPRILQLFENPDAENPSRLVARVNFYHNSGRQFSISTFSKSSQQSLYDWIDTHSSMFGDAWEIELFDFPEFETVVMEQPEFTQAYPSLFAVIATDYIHVFQLLCNNTKDDYDLFAGLVKSFEYFINVPAGFKTSAYDGDTEISPLPGYDVSTCCTYSSSGNPYPCCDPLGNCTWWSYRQRWDIWGYGSWGNAKDWLANARNAGFSTSTTPTLGDIMCLTNIGSYGHVAIVEAIGTNQVYVSEQNWCATCRQGKWWSYKNYNYGFIKRKFPANTIITDDINSYFAKYGTPGYWTSDYFYGYDGHQFYTLANGNTVNNYAKWSASISYNGNTEVQVFIPKNNATTKSAKYKIYYNGGTSVANKTINQNNYYDQWVSLGTYYFKQGSGNYVYLSDATGETPGSTKVSFDAVKFIKK